jgi:pseudaminic acid cytidylyltransferase
VNIAIIPARGGSKRILGKNIREFCGSPILVYSIRAAKKSGLFDRIIVSTDSEKIAEVALQHGAEVPFLRPENLSDDFATTADVILHTLKFVRTEYGEAQYACCIYATAPFLQAEYLAEGLEVLNASPPANNAFSVTSYAFPVFRAQRINEKGFLEMQWPEHHLTRSQDLPELYHDAGQFYWIRIDCFLDNPDLYANALSIKIPHYLVQDIDTEEDWIRAELMYKALNS